MNIARLQRLVLGIVDHDDCLEAQRILSDAKSYGELREENAKLKQQLENETKEHLEMEQHLTNRRSRAEDERDQAYLAARRISEEEFLKQAEARWKGQEIPKDEMNPLGKMMHGMTVRIKELETLLTERGKPESQIQAELLADMHRVNDAMWKMKATDDATRVALGNAINDAAIRFKVYNQMKAILEKK